MAVPAGPSAPPPAIHNRRLSRSNSTSSSVATVKPGYRKAHRASISMTRPTSSDSIQDHFSNLDTSTNLDGRPEASNAGRRARSPDYDSRRWSHAASNSLSGIDTGFVQRMSGAFGHTMATSHHAPQTMPKSQFSAAIRPAPQGTQNPASLQISPRKLRKIQRKPSLDSGTGAVSDGQNSWARPLAEKSREQGQPPVQRREQNMLIGDNFGATATLLDHQKATNRFGLPIEGLAIQYTPATQPKTRMRDLNKSASSPYKAANSSHISLQQVSQVHTHSRRRERSSNGSKDNTPGGSMSSVASDRSRGRSRRSAGEKSMLSQALAKANTAVILDNAGEISNAVVAYIEACNILQEVMKKSEDVEDRKKLAAIRETYSIRIAELYDLDNTFEHLNKDLPETPHQNTQYLLGKNLEELNTPTTEETPNKAYEDEEESPPRIQHIPPRQESLLPEIFGGQEFLEQKPALMINLPVSDSLDIPMDVNYMPPPLTPRKDMHEMNELPWQQSYSAQQGVYDISSNHDVSHLDDGERHSEPEDPELLSLFQDSRLLGQHEFQHGDADIDKKTGSSPELDQVTDITPRPSNAGEQLSTNAKPDDARFENSQGLQDRRMLASQESSNILNSSIRDGHGQDAKRLDHDRGEPMGDQDLEHHSAMLTEEEVAAQEAQEEEELLDLIMSHEHVMSSTRGQTGALSSLPRKSGSSSISARSSGRTWESSLTTTTSGTALSTLVESPELPQGDFGNGFDRSIDTKEKFPEHEVQNSLAQKQIQALPQLPSVVGIRDRRMSGQDAQQLKIETFATRSSISKQRQQQQAPAPLQAAPTPSPSLDVTLSSAHPELVQSASGTNLSNATLPLTPLASVTSSESPATPSLVQLAPQDSDFDDDLSLLNTSFNSIQSDFDRQRMPPPTIRPSTSASSSKRNLSLTTSNLDTRPVTPGSGIFSGGLRRTTDNSLLTPALSSHSQGGLPTGSAGGLYLFESVRSSSQHNFNTPTSATALRQEIVPLEPCPMSTLLRPFWLMRGLGTILSHPRGGHLTTKLFVPREMWQTRGIKLKAVEEKIAQCDVLTSALSGLSKVDTLDADAVLEELQKFENVIDEVRQVLSRRLGSDVGASSSAILEVGEMESTAGVGRSATGSSMKSITSGWKKLRSKSTATPTAAPSKSSFGLSGVGQDFTMSTLPMTTTSYPVVARTHPRHPSNTARFPPPTPTTLSATIPALHANYISSLARLFEAAQVLDNIARQVEDPGLKATNKTQVGLEIGIKGCAEFFGFYVLRFVLGDIGTVLEKYMKKSGEWICA